MHELFESAAVPISRFRGDHFFLSNFYRHPVEFEGETYPSVEHAFQAAKTNDPVIRERIRRAKDPQAAKRLGRQVMLGEDWEWRRFAVMNMLLRRKFADPELRALLDETKGHVLIEGNNWGDRIWGMVRVMRTTPWDDKPVPCWDGDNHLGRLLMEIRDE